MTTAELVAACSKWQTRKKSLLALSALPVAEKRADVYPAIIELATRLFCTEAGAKSVYYEIDPLVAFFMRELEHDAEVVAQLFAALPGPPVHNVEHFLSLVIGARDARAIPTLRELPDLWGYGSAVVAIDGAELSDHLLSRLRSGMPRDGATPVAAAFYAPAAARSLLHALAKGAPNIADALALIGDAEDCAWIKALRSDKDGLQPKRLHAALTKPKLGDRIKSLDAIAKAIRTKETSLSMLLGMCKLFADPSPDIVARAAKALREYCRIGKKANTSFHAVFLRTAAAAIARGVTKDARKSLEAIHRTIPRAASLPQGPTATKDPGVAPPKRKTR